MARIEKEVVVIVLDVSKTMCQNSTSSLESAIKAVNLLVQQKLLFKPKDEIGLILFGTKETNNQLEEDGYQNVCEERSILPPDIDFLRLIQQIKPGGAEGDFIDALIVGMNMLIKKMQSIKAASSRLILVTNAAAPVNAEDLDVVLNKFKQMNANLNIIGIDFEDDDSEDGLELSPEEDNPASVKKQNEKLLHSIADNVDGIVIPVQRALEIMSYFRSSSVSQTTTFQGFLEISSLKIRVKAYIKTKGASFPTMKKYSLVAADLENPTTTEVERQMTYHSIDDLDTALTPENKVKGYKYGKSIVPYSDADESVLKYNCTSCLQLIGFTKNSNVPIHHYMNPTEVICADANEPHATTALSAIIRAMIETESSAIVRYSKRKDSVMLAVLQPHVSDESEYFYVHKLPFAEDIRYYQFAPLDPERARPAFVPSSEQLSAMEDLINDFDLSQASIDEDGNTMEALKPKYTYNPALQRFYQTLQTRSLNPDAPIPKLDKQIEEYVNPDARLLERAASALEACEQLFKLERVKPEEKVQRRFWANSTVDELRLDSYATADHSAKKSNAEFANLNLDSIITGGTSDVGPINPVKDFQDMLSRRDVDLVDKAIEQMKERITQLVSDSIRDSFYPKAIECIQALRVGCVQEEEPIAFNSFLRSLRTMYEDKGRHQAFWQLIKKKSISLIYDEECEDSDVTKEQADEFLQDAVEEPTPVEISEPTSVDEVDDLFDMIE